MAETPSVGWVGAAVRGSAGGGTYNQTSWGWVAPADGGVLPTLGFAPAGNTIRMTTAEKLQASVITVGSLSVASSFGLLGGAGGYLLDVTPAGPWACEVGMWMVPVTGIIPNGLQIVQAAPPPTAQIVLGGEEAMADIANGISPASADGVFKLPVNINQSCVAVDAYCYGTLAATVTPSTGVTIQDYNYDGTGNSENVGNGTAACNEAGQATGDFAFTFANAGTYTLGCAYTSDDPNYNDATVSPPLTVVVS